MKNVKPISLSKAALIAGLTLLGLAIVAPFAEMYALPKLIVSFNASETAQNIIANKSLFVMAILAYLLAFILDLIVTWALYIFMKPVNEDLSLLTAWFRLVYTVISLVALNNLVTGYRLLTTPEYLTIFQPEQLHVQAMIFLKAFRNHWYFGLIFFALHLFLLGYLAIKSDFIPKIMGILLIITGLGYLLNTLKPYLFPSVNTDFALYTFFGELIFMVWLLIKGSRLKEI